ISLYPHFYGAALSIQNGINEDYTPIKRLTLISICGQGYFIANVDVGKFGFVSIQQHPHSLQVNHFKHHTTLSDKVTFRHIFGSNYSSHIRKNINRLLQLRRSLELVNLAGG